MGKNKSRYKSVELFRVAHNRQRARWRERYNFGDGTHRHWTDEEIKLIMEHKICDTEIARKIGRSAAAVQVKRSKINKEINQ